MKLIINPINKLFVYDVWNALHQERIIEKKGRGRERETTTHLIKFPVFTHASRVTKFRYDYDARIRMYVSNSADAT